MAEGLLRHRLKSVEVKSAGLAAGFGQAPSQYAILAMTELGIDISNQRSQPVTPELIQWADVIFVMTHGHLDMMLMLFPSAADKIFLVREFETETPAGIEIGDPFGGSLEHYLAVRKQLERAMPSLEKFLLSTEVPHAVVKAHHSRVHLAFGADHGGYELKKDLVQWCETQGYPVTDLGANSADSVDYPDYAQKVAVMVANHEVDFGVLICRSGIGMSIAANRVTGVRAAVINNEKVAHITREHNDTNVLCLSADEIDVKEAQNILQVWLTTPFAGGRHERRVEKIEAIGMGREGFSRRSSLAKSDEEIFSAVESELKRQGENIELIASENFTSRAVMEAQGSCLTNKYAEGYPGKRWYGGCEFVDEVERLAIERAQKLFQADHANVQPHSGSQANMAVYFSVLKPGDKILTMNLAHGGHLTHGHPMNFSGKIYEVIHYGVSKKTETIDYDEVARLASEHRPRMITAGASAYSRFIDFKRLREIADEIEAYLFIDMAHIAGLVATGLHPSPIPFADFVTSTTHKTLRGPRGGIILCQEKYAKEIDALVFPGVQGGPLMHVIAAKAVCFKEALQPGFIEYQKQVVRNAKALCEGMKRNGFRIVSGTTENHLMLVDLQSQGMTGKEAQEVLDQAGITVNKNAIPFDTQSPFKAGGMRLGTPAVTTRGFKEEEMFEVADLIHHVLLNRTDAKRVGEIRHQVRQIMRRYPLPH